VNEGLHQDAVRGPSAAAFAIGNGFAWPWHRFIVPDTATLAASGTILLVYEAASVAVCS